MLRATNRTVLLILLFATLAIAKKKEPPQPIVMLWPSQDNATLKLTFNPFRELAAYSGQMTLVSDVVVQNLTAKLMPRASLTVSLLDQNRVRIGNGVLSVDDLNAGESAKILFQCTSVGTPAMLSIAAHNMGGVPTSTKTIPITIISIPPGAALKIDDKDAGTTPATVHLIAGTHNLELRKEGYADAKTPLDINPDEAPGGSMTITLGGLDSDTIELRDGSILKGDVLSMSIEAVVIRVNGQDQSFDRNRIRKIFLAERVVTHTVVGPESPSPATRSNTGSTKPTPH